MKTKVEILSAEQVTRHFEHSKSERWKCKCVIRDDATGAVEVGTLNIPAALWSFDKELQPGFFELDYKVGRGWSDVRLQGVLCSFEPVISARAARPVAVEKAAA